MDLLEEYSELFEDPMSFENMLKQREQLDAAILKLTAQKVKLEKRIKKDCKHYAVRVSKEYDYDRNRFSIDCEACGENLYYGNRWGFDEYLEKHDVMVTNQL